MDFDLDGVEAIVHWHWNRIPLRKLTAQNRQIQHDCKLIYINIKRNQDDSEVDEPNKEGI